jgi:hypothetical protein
LNKASFALTCSLLVLLTGCGGGSHAGAKATAEGRAACAQATAAEARYHRAGVAQNVKFLNKALDAATLAAAQEFRRSAEQLEPVSSSSEKRELGQLVSALAQQEKVLMAFAAYDLATARRYVTGLNEALFKSLANFKKICGA